MRLLDGKRATGQSHHLKALAALAKRKRGERLTDQEEIILAYLVYAGGCHACKAAGAIRVTDLVQPTEIMN